MLIVTLYSLFLRRDEFKELLGKKDWSETTENTEISEGWNIFRQTLETLVEEIVPTKTRKRKRTCKSMWWNKTIYKLRHKRLKLWNIYKERTLHEDYNRYNCWRKTRREIRKSKRRPEKRLSDNKQKDRKGFFIYPRSKMKVKEGVRPTDDANGDLIHDDSLTAHIFNDYLASVFTEEDVEDMPNVQSMYNGEPEEMLNDMEINETKVMKKLMSLSPTKAPGDGGIVLIVLKKAAEELTYPITKLYRR